MRRAGVNGIGTRLKRFGRRVRGLWGDRRGVTAIITALGMTVLIGAAGLAIDVAYWEATQRSVQGAADQASLAATLTMDNGGTLDEIVAEGKSVAAQHGYVDGQNGVKVIVNWPPTSGAYKNNTSCVEVIIEKPTQTFFSRMFLG